MRGVVIISVFITLTLFIIVSDIGAADIGSRLTEGNYLLDCRYTILDAPSGPNLKLFPVHPGGMFEALSTAMARQGASPMVYFNLALQYRQWGDMAVMNAYFDSVLMAFDNPETDSANALLCSKEFYEGNIGSLRKMCWTHLMTGSANRPLWDFLRLAVNSRSSEPHTILLRNNLNRLHQVAERFPPQPRIFYMIGEAYRGLGVLDSMNTFFDSALIYCADNALYYSERECCDHDRYEMVIDSLRRNVVAGVSPTEPHIAMVHFYDNFENNVNGWPEGRYGGAAFGFGKGKYAVSMISPENIAAAKLPVRVDREFVIETTLKKSDGDKNSGYGLLWGGNAKGDYYTFVINGNGQYTVNRLKGGQWADFIAWQPSEFINPGNAINKLQIRQIGEVAHFLINDHVIGRLEAQEPFGDYLGFIDVRDVTFAAEYILVYRPRSFVP